jgi:hypothetical protein
MSEPQFDAFRARLTELEAEAERLAEAGLVDWQEKNLPEDIRSKLLRLGASIGDYVLWVRERPQPDDISPEAQMYWAEEMEAGTGAWGVTAREALDHYFSDDLLDRRRWTDDRGLDFRCPGDERSNRRQSG